MKTAQTFTAQIFIAGDLADARRACRDFCNGVGLCVTVEPVDYVYTGGMESGVRVGLINYPRFPSEPAAILDRAKQLADDLLIQLAQHSWTIITPTETYWHSIRPERDKDVVK